MNPVKNELNQHNKIDIKVNYREILINFFMCIFLPPYAVMRRTEKIRYFYLNFFLCYLFFIPGIIHALIFTYYNKEPKFDYWIDVYKGYIRSINLRKLIVGIFHIITLGIPFLLLYMYKEIKKGNISVWKIIKVTFHIITLGIPYLIYLASIDKNKVCAWCNKRELKFQNGKINGWYWEYRNKDGSRDKRVKDNYQLSGYTSQYKCSLCEAITEFKHFVDKDPSEDIKVYKRILKTNGKGSREGNNWESSNATTVYTATANRKGY